MREALSCRLQALLNNRVLRFIKNTFKLMTVEPIIILVFLALQIYYTSLSAGLYQIICTQLFDQRPIKVDCQNAGTMSLADQNRIQRNLTIWAVILALSHFVTGMMSSCLLGAWGDIGGRKLNFLLSTAGLLLSVAPTAVFFEFKSISLWYLAILNVISSCFGYVGLTLLSAYAYLCDIVLDKKELSIRLTMLSGFMSLASIAGSLVSGALLGTDWSLSWTCVVSSCLLCAAFFYALFRLEDSTPAQLREEILSKHPELNTTDTPLSNMPENKIDSNSSDVSNRTEDIRRNASLNIGQKVRRICETVFSLLKDIYNTYAKLRPSHERCFLIMTSLILFLFMMANTGIMTSIISHYVFREPFYWTSGEELGYWKAAKGTIGFAGSIFGVLLFKKYFKMRDTTIILISAVSCAAELITVAFSTASWMLYVAVTMGLFSNLFMPFVGTLISKIVKYDELGKSFTGHGIASSLSFMTSAIIFNGIYNVTLKFMPGFVFLFGACIVAVCFAAVLWMHFITIKYGILEDTLTTNEGS